MSGARYSLGRAPALAGPGFDASPLSALMRAGVLPAGGSGSLTFYEIDWKYLGPRNARNELLPLKDTLDNFYPHITEVSTKILGYDVSYQPVFAYDPITKALGDGYIYGGSYTPFPIDLSPTLPLGHDLKIERGVFL